MALLDDLYLSRYDKKLYNCAHFAGDVWQRLRNDDRIARIAAIYTEGKLPPFRQFLRMIHGFKVTDKHADLAIVLCNPPFSELHMGILKDGHLLHLTPMGVECLELCVYESTYKNMRFYK